jgi:hypothetical protein
VEQAGWGAGWLGRWVENLSSISSYTLKLFYFVSSSLQISFAKKIITS